jgi:hypothetical protein
MELGSYFLFLQEPTKDIIIRLRFDDSPRCRLAPCFKTPHNRFHRNTTLVILTTIVLISGCFLNTVGNQQISVRSSSASPIFYLLSARGLRQNT